MGKVSPTYWGWPFIISLNGSRRIVYIILAFGINNRCSTKLGKLERIINISLEIIISAGMTRRRRFSEGREVKNIIIMVRIINAVLEGKNSQCKRKE